MNSMGLGGKSNGGRVTFGATLAKLVLAAFGVLGWPQTTVAQPTSTTASSFPGYPAAVADPTSSAPTAPSGTALEASVPIPAVPPTAPAAGQQPPQTQPSYLEPTAPAFGAPPNYNAQPAYLPPPTPPQPRPAQPAAAASGEAEAAVLPDHLTVGSVAFGLGSIRKPRVRVDSVLDLGQGTADQTSASENETVPALEGRWWLGPQRRIGIDLGLSYFNVTVHGESNQLAKLRAFYVKTGLPIALTSTKHTTIELIPQISYMGAGATVTSLGLSLFRWDAALRLSAEIQFGFIGIPELSLQSGIGMSFTREVSRQRRTGTLLGETDSARVVITEVGPYGGKGPWEIFLGNLAALYYF